MPAVVTAVELAGRLRVDPKVFRAWLRRQAAAGHELLRTNQHQASWTFTEDEARQLAAEYRRSTAGPSDPAFRAEAVTGVPSREERFGADRPRSPEAAGADGSVLRGHQVQMDWLGSTVTTLADLLRPGLKAVTVGINPAPVSVAAGHYYQGSAGQTFYRRLAAVGLLPAGQGFEDDRAFAAGIGFTDVVKRPTGNANQVSPHELVVGRRILEEKLRVLEVPPVIFTFKKAATSVLGGFSGHGLLPAARLAGGRVFVMPGPYERREQTARALQELTERLAQSGLPRQT
jgi:TDG/mug DNA glycosylase family protein